MYWKIVKVKHICSSTIECKNEVFEVSQPPQFPWKTCICLLGRNGMHT